LLLLAPEPKGGEDYDDDDEVANHVLLRDKACLAEKERAL